MVNKNTLILSVITFLFSSCNSQTEDKANVSEKKVLDALKEWSDSIDSFPRNRLNPLILEQLNDSGQIINNLKEGIWVEYSIDSSNYNQPIKVQIGEKTFDYELGLKLTKAIGAYKQNKKTGKWITYHSSDTELPINWSRETTSEFKNGLKDGEEITYQGFGEEHQRPIQIIHFSKGIESGLGFYYFSKEPYNLRWSYDMKNGKMHSTKEYYENGNLKWSKSDTTINKTSGIYLKQYDENAHPKSTAFIINDSIFQGPYTEYYINGKIESITEYKNGKQNGSYKYFFSNGQLWTERLYVNNKLMNIISNFDSNGKPKEKGTLKNGNGTLIVYDEIGKQKEIEEYKDGEEVNQKQNSH